MDYRGIDLVHDRVDVPDTPWFRGDFEPTKARVRPIVEPGSSSGPTLHDLYTQPSVAADETQFHITDNEQFCAGGVQRGRIWRDYSLLPRFSEYLGTLPPDELEEVLADQRDGIDIWRDLDPEYVERVRPSDAERLRVRQSREVTCRNSALYLKRKCTRLDRTTKCECHICFLIHTIISYLVQGTVQCLGLTKVVRSEGRLPYELANLTLEETKPRACYDCRELNDATRDRATTLEGLHATRAYVVGRETLGCCLDEKAGYSNHLMTELSSMLLGFCLFGYCFVYRTLPFGWKLGAFIHQRTGMILTGYARFMGSRVTQYIGTYDVVGVY